MIQEYSFLGFPLSGNEVRKIAFSFAEANGFEGFSKVHNEAGRKRFHFLLKRYPQLKVKETVTNLSIARANATRKSLVLGWYKKYENVLQQLEITDPKYIWNIDEHGSEDMPKVKKVIGLKGIKQFQKQPHEKPKRTTMLTYVNAAGFALPPLVIHKGHQTVKHFLTICLLLTIRVSPVVWFSLELRIVDKFSLLPSSLKCFLL